MRSPEMGGIGLDLTAVSAERPAACAAPVKTPETSVWPLLHAQPSQLSQPQPAPLNPPFLALPRQDPVPPEDPFVQVRVVRDYGETTFSSGSVKLRRGQSHWLPRDEAHGLIMDGVLACVGGGRGA